MKTLGFLGGMTYHSTSSYYTLINGHINQALGGSASASIIIHSFNHAETAALFASGRWDAVTDKFVAAARQLKQAGAQGVAIGCNLGHKVADELEIRSGLPVLHIADFAAAAIKKRQLAKVALIATRTVMEDDFVKKRLVDKAGVEVIVPDQEDRIAIDVAIFDEIGAGIFSDKTTSFLASVVEKLAKQQGAQAVLLACTDLQFVLKQDNVSIPLLDTVELHAKGLADWSLSD